MINPWISAAAKGLYPNAREGFKLACFHFLGGILGFVVMKYIDFVPSSAFCVMFYFAQY